jgi:hypothetical protein
LSLNWNRRRRSDRLQVVRGARDPVQRGWQRTESPLVWFEPVQLVAVNMHADKMPAAASNDPFVSASVGERGCGLRRPRWPYQEDLQFEQRCLADASPPLQPRTIFASSSMTRSTSGINPASLPPRGGITPPSTRSPVHQLRGCPRRGAYDVAAQRAVLSGPWSPSPRRAPSTGQVRSLRCSSTAARGVPTAATWADFQAGHEFRFVRARSTRNSAGAGRSADLA